MAERPRGLRRFTVGAALLVVALALPLVPTRQIESWWARSAYPAWTRLLVPGSETAPPGSAGGVAGTPLAGSWSLGLLLVVGAALGVALAVSVRTGRWRGFAATLLLVLGAGALIVTAGWGLGYRRPPAAELLALPERGIATETLLERLLTEVERADAEVPAGPLAAATERAAHGAVSAALAGLLADRVGGSAPRLPAAPKALPAGTLLRGGYSGIVSPITLEAHVDAGLPPWARIATGAHELAHVAGFAREADAELIGALAALGSDAPAARYAAALTQWTRIVARLPEAERRAWLERLPERARTDLEALSAASDRWRSPRWSAWVDAIYARWLRSQGESAGLAAYDAGSELLARAAAAGLLPR